VKVARKEEVRNAYRILEQKSLGKYPFGTKKKRMKLKIKKQILRRSKSGLWY
jgi:hypothetical protein